MYNDGMSLTAPLHPVLATGTLDIGIVPTMPEYTVAQAAKFLNMSEGCVDDLLNIGVMEYRQDGNKRWIQQDSLFEYESDYRKGRKAMAEITRMAQEMGLYD